MDIIRPLKDHKITSIPDNVTFECEWSVSGLKVEWCKGDREISRSEKYEISCDGGVHRLTIRDVDGRDVADYCCVYKTKSTEGKLEVVGEYYLQTQNIFIM